jgi:hypothetical protein
MSLKRTLATYKAAMEHDSPEALKKYLHDHPDADKSNHTVKKPSQGADMGKEVADLDGLTKGLKSSDLPNNVADQAKFVAKQVKDLNKATLKLEEAAESVEDDHQYNAVKQALSELFKSVGEGPKSGTDRSLPKGWIGPKEYADWSKKVRTEFKAVDALLKKHGLKKASLDFQASLTRQATFDDPDMAPGEAALEYLLTSAKRAYQHVGKPRIAVKELNWVMDAMGAYLGAVDRATGVDLSQHAALANKLANMLDMAAHRIPQHIEVPNVAIDDDQMWEPGD